MPLLEESLGIAFFLIVLSFAVGAGIGDSPELQYVGSPHFIFRVFSEYVRYQYLLPVGMHWEFTERFCSRDCFTSRLCIIFLVSLIIPLLTMVSHSIIILLCMISYCPLLYFNHHLSYGANFS